MNSVCSHRETNSGTTDNQFYCEEVSGTGLHKMTTVVSKKTCHNRWCPLPPPLSNGTWDISRCHNLWNEFNDTSGANLAKILYACCKLHCEPHSQLLQLQCQGTSKAMAITTWVIVSTLMACAVAFVVAIPMERGFGKKLAVLGGVLLFSFTGVTAFVFGGNADLLDTPLYPIIGAMNVATFSYLFSGYQYSISLVYELASAATLVFTMIPIWSLLTINLSKIIVDTSAVDNFPTNMQWWSANIAGLLAVAMLCVSILWVIHSSLFRTVGYMAAWIGAFTSQKKQNVESYPVNPKNFMRSLWVLAAGDGHPTWRTPVGQALGLYLVVLSWNVSIVSQIFLNNTCDEDLFLLRMMMWFPPALLTLVVIINQSVIIVKSAACSSPDISFPGQGFKETHEFYTRAVIIYRLGRKGMDVRVDDEYNHRCKGRMKQTDKALAFFVIVFEGIFFVVAYAGFRILKALQHLARKRLLPADGTITTACGSQGCQYCSGCMAWGPYGACEAKRRKIAFKILCDHCGERSAHRYNLPKDSEAVVKTEVRRLLSQHLDKIDLPLLLDNIHPSGLSYILEQLEEEREKEVVALPSNSATLSTDDQRLLTISHTHPGIDDHPDLERHFPFPSEICRKIPPAL